MTEHATETLSAPLNWNKWIRQIHRWLSIAFTVAVIANIAAMGQVEPALWVGLLALFPLVLLLLTGLYLFALPYAAKWRNGQRTVPGVSKAVKWNSPFYGVEDNVWFVSFHCFTKYVKVTFFRGTSLHPVPPGSSKHPEVRYLDIHEDAFDEAQIAAWVKQASELPGERM